jgi:hypothetical protein
MAWPGISAAAFFARFTCHSALLAKKIRLIKIVPPRKIYASWFCESVNSFISDGSLRLPAEGGDILSP